MIFDADVAEEMLSAFAQKSSRSSRSRRRRSSSSSSSSSHREEEEGGNDDDDNEEEEDDDDDNEDTRLPSWGESIIREAYKEPENAHIGFSEYESYASFVSTRHPESEIVDVEKLGQESVLCWFLRRCCHQIARCRMVYVARRVKF